MLRRLHLIGLAVIGCLFTSNSISRLHSAQAPMWVTGYWFSPSLYGNLPVSDIDFSALTHVIHCYVLPNTDGTLDPATLQAVADYAPSIVNAAHSNGVAVLLGVAQTGSGGDFPGATRPANIDSFVANIMNVVNQFGYDGVDIDWEANIDPGQFTNFVTELRGALDAQTPKGTLTGSFFSPPPPLSLKQTSFDQINLMTYDMCSALDGFTWHNAALYNAGDSQRRTVDSRLHDFAQIIGRSKLGLGIPFYGYVWKGGAGTWTDGVTAPGQTWSVKPNVKHRDYRNIINDPALWQDQNKRRDSWAGGVPYLSISQSDASGDTFVTYDDEISIAAKISYAKNQGLGGLMIYELSADYVPNGSPMHPLMQAVKSAMTPPAQ
jgi:chitinase